jgi:hypothetical protein
MTVMYRGGISTETGRRYPECDQCGFKFAYGVNTENGLIRLCGGCIADVRSAGGRAEMVKLVRR